MTFLSSLARAGVALELKLISARADALINKEWHLMLRLARTTWNLDPALDGIIQHWFAMTDGSLTAPEAALLRLTVIHEYMRSDARKWQMFLSRMPAHMHHLYATNLNDVSRAVWEYVSLYSLADPGPQNTETRIAPSQPPVRSDARSILKCGECGRKVRRQNGRNLVTCPHCGSGTPNWRWSSQ